MKTAIGLFGSFVMAIGGAILFYFLYELTTTYFQMFTSPDSLVAFLGFMSFLFLGLGLFLIVQSGTKD
jgi:lipopolysaccharide export LptBFGC system permease protein LptF